MLRRLAVVLGSGALLLGVSGTGAAAPAGSWRTVPDGPLRPREQAVMVWTGEEVLIVGGLAGPPCPPSADCASGGRPLRDGAAYRPGSRLWRRIARAPVGIEWGEPALVGRTLYVLANGSVSGGPPRAFLAYSLDRNRWRRLRVPRRVTRDADFQLVAAGDRLVAYSSTDDAEYGAGPTRVYDRRTNRWVRLPRDPLAPSVNRQLVWTGDRLVMLGCDYAEPNYGGPCLVQAAAYDFATGRWERLPDSQIDSYGVWVAAGMRIVNPSTGSSDGGDTNPWPRAYPNGGVLDLGARTWSPLPHPPSTNEVAGTGVLTSSGAYYAAPRGWVLDTTIDMWFHIGRPPLPRRADWGQTVAAGRSLFLFGGARWKGDRYVPLDGAWIWTPPAPR